MAWSVRRRSSPLSSASRYSRKAFDVIALLPEGEAQVVVARGSGIGQGGSPQLQRLVVDDPGGTGAAAERKIGLGPGERGIERNRALGGGPGGFMLAQVPVQERQQIVGVGVVRVQADTFL
jgi:hypothetical protein